MSRYVTTRSSRTEHGNVHTVTVAHERRLNVLNTEIIEALRQTLKSIENDGDARVIRLCGEGERAWIGGADIREMATLDPRSARHFITGLHHLCDDLRTICLPVVAQIDGYCLGAGLEVAACCDLRLASTRTTFGMPEVQIAIPSVIEAAVLPRLIGAGPTRDLVMTGRTIDAWQAASWGLIDQPVAANELERLCDERIKQLLSADRNALAEQKTLCRQWEELPLHQAVKEGVEAFARSYESGAPQRRMRAFLERKRG